jgi:hypothetical protein
MKAFEVYVNGERVCTAGIGPDGVLSAILSWVGSGRRGGPDGHLDFSVGGLDSRTDEYVRWAVPELRVGDEVSVLVVEAEQVDPEQERERSDRSGADGAGDPERAD